MTQLPPADRGEDGNHPIYSQLSRATIYRMVARGDFPKAVRRGEASAWPHSEVVAHVEMQINQRVSAN